MQYAHYLVLIDGCNLNSTIKSRLIFCLIVLMLIKYCDPTA